MFIIISILSGAIGLTDGYPDPVPADESDTTPTWPKPRKRLCPIDENSPPHPKSRRLNIEKEIDKVRMYMLKV